MDCQCRKKQMEMDGQCRKQANGKKKVQACTRMPYPYLSPNVPLTFWFKFENGTKGSNIWLKQRQGSISKETGPFKTEPFRFLGLA